MSDPYTQQQELEEFSQRMKMLQQQFQLLQQQLNELQSVQDALKELDASAKGHEFLVPMGAGVLAKATMHDTKRVVMNVGADVLVEKSTADALKLIEMQMEQLKTIGESLATELSEVQGTLQGLQMHMMQPEGK